MYKIATKIFIGASIAFAIIGIIMIIAGGPDDSSTVFKATISKLFFCTIFIILSSFALSIAGKYLNNRS